MDLALFFILPLIGGFAFATGFDLLRYSTGRQDSQRLYYQAAKIGVGISMSAPTPCRRRPASRDASVGANAQTSDAARKRPTLLSRGVAKTGGQFPGPSTRPTQPSPSWRSAPDSGPMPVPFGCEAAGEEKRRTTKGPTSRGHA